jgi:radical SAM protein with 4Fe4S-binding SPASM domain
MKLSPAYFFLQFTSVCNSRCVSCHLWKSEPVTLSVETFKRVDRFFDPSRLMSVYFTGGEPLLAPHCVEMALAINEWKPGVCIPMATNSLCPELYLPRIKAMKDAGLRVRAYVSLNGPPDIHDASRGVPGNYEKTIQMAEGLKDIDALQALNILFIPGVTTGSHVAHCQEIARRLGTYCSSSPILRHSPWFGQEDDGATVPLFNCHAGDVLAIRPNGDITACQEPRPQLIFGNLNDEELDAAKAERIMETIHARGCQPCGCCTNAFTHGAICMT